MAIKEKWQNLDPKNKKKIVTVTVLAGIIIIALLGYTFSRSGKESSKPAPVEKEISLKPHILQKGVSQELRMKQQGQQKEIERLKKIVKRLQQEIEQKEKEKEKISSIPTIPPTTRNQTSTRGISIPPPPPPSEFPGEISMEKKKIVAEPTMIGDIDVASNTPPKTENKKKEKKKEREVYLPPSFMEATLLSGLDAPTMEGAKGNPVPALLRVKDLAILPNDVKANLKGCFVIAEGIGRLDTERVELRLVSLSCIAKNGQAVIDQKVKGFIVDADGKIGLKGRVVAKLGSVLARTALAGFLEGFGDAASLAGQTSYVSGLGTQTTMKSSDIFKAGAGKGVAKASHKLADFYMKLAEQTLPVVEVGATKKVTLVVSQGVDLKIRKVCVGGSKCE